MLKNTLPEQYITVDEIDKIQNEWVILFSKTNMIYNSKNLNVHSPFATISL